MDSIEYYSQNASEYFERTVNIDMQDNWDRFTELLTEGSSILDLGCGSGRDSEYFLSRGFDVTAMDASEEMCDLATIHIGQDVLKLTFDEIDFDEVFDGIWASASLLHVPSSHMNDIMGKVIKSLKRNGILFMSFYYGDFEGERDGRYYTDYRTKELKELIARQNYLELIEVWKEDDSHTNHENNGICVLARKIEQD